MVSDDNVPYMTRDDGVRQVSLQLPADLLDALETDATENERSFAASVRYYLRAGLTKEGKR